MTSGAFLTYEVPRTWGGRFWPRTDCSNTSGEFICSTGSCLGFDGHFSQSCVVSGNNSPTLAELFLDTFGKSDYYDVSMVDGVNLGVRITPDKDSYNLDAGIDRTSQCSNDNDCYTSKKDVSWVCGVSGNVQGVCVNKFHCGSPGCISRVDCDNTGFSSLISDSVKLKPSQWGDRDLAIKEEDCKDELKLKVGGIYVGCLSPKDACKSDKVESRYKEQVLKCDQSAGAGTYLDLYSCINGYKSSCYTAGAPSNCCGCPDWLPTTICQNTNQTWIDNAKKPYYDIFNTASPTSYCFPYDDKNSTFTCVGKSSQEYVNYRITFCPKNTNECTYIINPSVAHFANNGGTAQAVVTSSGCSWTAVSNANWITITSGSSGSGSGTVTYTVSANSGSSRTGTIAIGNQNHTVEQTDTAFADVNSSMWSKNYIVAIYNSGITVGCIQSPIRFYCPSTPVTRGQMAAFIIRAKYGENFTYPPTPYFSDVPANHNFFMYVQRLKQDGITIQEGIYRVNDDVSRGEMAAFIIRAKYGENFAFSPSPYFSDVPVNHTFFKYVQKLKEDGITTQTGIYRVDDIVSREEMSAFISRGFLGMQ